MQDFAVFQGRFFFIGFAGDISPESGEMHLERFIAPIDRFGVIDDRTAFCAESRDDHGKAGSDIRGGDDRGAEFRWTADDDAMRIAVDDLRAHSDQVVHEIESAFEHFFEEGDKTIRLGCEDDQNGEQIGRKRGPDSVVDFRNGVREVRFDPERVRGIVLIANPMVLDREGEAESFQRSTENFEFAPFDGADIEGAVCDGGCDQIGSGFDIVAPDAECSPVEAMDAMDDNPVCSDAGNIGSHLNQHFAEILNMRFAGGIVEIGFAVGEDGGHDEVFRAGDRGFAEQVLTGSVEAGRDGKRVGWAFMEFGSHCAKTANMRIEAALSDDIASGRVEHHVSAAGEKRTDEQEGSPDLAAKLVRKAGRGDGCGLNRDDALFLVQFHRRSDRFQEFEHTADVSDKRNVGQGNGFGSQKRSGQHGQCRVFVAGGIVHAPQGDAALNDKSRHGSEGVEHEREKGRGRRRGA